ncbi:chymotrypsin-1-like [Lutzomyia longipalpis]|uniref:chymotrypsin-1-like n=1 Tax=Lutzomyia longipalpis TaxID=7200 RepID=UPI0024838605|nr:chymotrypsin-1-like [Lutzomyia longipalpis]
MLRLILFCIIFASGLLGFVLGKDPDGNNLVDTTTTAQFPFVTTLSMRLRGIIIARVCSGTIVSDRWVLSAAHCLAEATPESTSVFIGHGQPGGTTEILADTLITYPFYEPTTRINDIGLIRTRDQIVFNDFIQPLPIGKEEVPGGVSAVTVGFTGTSVRWVFSSTLTNSECIEAVGMPDSVLDSNICAMRIDEGDHGFILPGSILMVGNTAAGILFWSIPSPEFIDSFIRLSEFHDWIQAVIQ